ncbi:MAG: SIS domain-containing protein [Negativicutes bacterium]|nr:SIS domain-containing protein [Negativicutes bacterium]
MSLESDIFDQPGVLSNLLVRQAGAANQVARAIRDNDVQYIFLAARGTSDNAGRFAQYLWGARNGLPVALAAPSLFTYYHQPPQLKGALVMGISQSGMSPDIVSVLQEARRQGRPTVTITNTPSSPLSEAAGIIIDTQAGVEKAVAATKTYTSELMSIAMISAALRGELETDPILPAVPGWVAQMLALKDEIARLAERYRFMQQCVVLGRGFNYATAFEWALKLKELTYVGAEPYSTADFQHGPIAVVQVGFPVMAVASSGDLFDSFFDLLSELRAKREADLLVLSDQDKALDLAQAPIRLPAGVPEWISPIVNIIAAQLFSFCLTKVKGYDTENPRGLRKVTETN